MRRFSRVAWSHAGATAVALTAATALTITGGTPAAPRAPVAGATKPEQGVVLRITASWRQVPGTRPAHRCNLVDRVRIRVDVPVGIFGDGTLAGTGTGTAKWATVSRCSGTFYGGERTVAGPTFTVAGARRGGDYQVTLREADVTEFFYTSKKVYASGNTFDQFLGYTRGRGVEGTLRSFALPAGGLEVGKQYRFETAPDLARDWSMKGPVTLLVVKPTRPVVVPSCLGEYVTIAGTSKPDTIVGTSEADVIAAGGGNDTVRGGGGNDLICGQAGNDHLEGGKGARDRLDGGPGSDRCIDSGPQTSRRSCERT